MMRGSYSRLIVQVMTGRTVQRGGAGCGGEGQVTDPNNSRCAIGDIMPGPSRAERTGRRTDCSHRDRTPPPPLRRYREARLVYQHEAPSRARDPASRSHRSSHHRPDHSKGDTQRNHSSLPTHQIQFPKTTTTRHDPDVPDKQRRSPSIGAMATRYLRSASPPPLPAPLRQRTSRSPGTGITTHH